MSATSPATNTSEVGETGPRTWLITEVDDGIGRSVSEQLLAFGERVVGTVRDLDSVTDLAERHPGMFRAERLDVSDTAQVRQVVGRAFAQVRRIDVIVSTVESIGLIHAALPHLRTQGGGRILQLSPAVGQGGVEGFVEAVTEDVAPFGVGLTLVEPTSGDLFEMAEAMIESVDEEPAPLRLALG